MEAGGQPHASRFIPMRRISPPVQMNRRLSEPLIQSGYLRGEKIFVPFLGCFLDSRSEMSCIQNVHGDVLICPFLCVSIGCPSFRSSVCLLAAHLSVPLCVYWLPICPFLCVSIGCSSVRSSVCLLAAHLSVPLCVYWLPICPKVRTFELQRRRMNFEKHWAWKLRQWQPPSSRQDYSSKRR